MSNNTLLLQSTLKSTPPNKNQNKLRLLKIQQKLETISLQRKTQPKVELHEQLTTRITDLQTKCTEEVKRVESNVRVLRQQLVEAQLKGEQLNKKLELTHRARRIEMAELQQQLASLLSKQSKDGKDVELVLAKLIETKTDGLAKELREVRCQRVQKINELQAKLQYQIPSVHLQITEKSQQISQKLQQIHSKARKQSENYNQSMREHQVHKQKSTKAIMQTINTTVQQIKHELQQQIIERNQNKQRLLALFDSAYAKLKPTQ